MGDRIMVTIQCSGYEYDMDLPVKLPLNDLCYNLLKALQEINPGTFGRYQRVILLHDGKHLADPYASLYHYGIATGAYLEVVEA